LCPFARAPGPDPGADDGAVTLSEWVAVLVLPLTLSVTGSAIGKLTPIDLMSKTFTLAFSQSGGHQAPESFEDDSATHALSMSVGAGGAESAGLSAAAKLTNEEKLEVKAEV